MGTLLALTVGLVIWIVGWAFGIKSFDVFLITVFILVIALAVRLTAPSMQQLLGRTPHPDA